MKKTKKATWKDIAELAAVDAGHSSSAGNRTDLTKISIVMRNGKRFELPIADQHSYGNNRIEDGHEEPITVAEFCRGNNIQPKDIAKVIKYNEYYCAWENADSEEEIIFLLNV